MNIQSPRRIKFENEILDPARRALIIREIEGTENLQRKDDSYRRYLCYKDQTNRFVVENLLRQFDLDTVVEMRYAIANISIVKKIIDKLARVYSNGVTRAVDGNDDATDILQKLEKILKLNTEMKRTNRFLKLEKNVAFYIKPCPVYSPDGGEVKWTAKLEPLCPHHYDVVEDYYDRTKPLCYILSDYAPRMTNYAKLDFGLRPMAPSVTPNGDGIDQTIADNPEDEGRADQATRKYIWWSKTYHFTTDNKGVIIPDEGNPDGKNPFEVDMIVNFALDQDGSFWAQGGGDLVEGATLINSMITHLNNIGVLQSYGQLYMTGKNLPSIVKVGPNKVIKMEYQKDDDPEPKVGFLNASPMLDSLRGCIEAYVALLLTTNNLSTSGVSAQLQSGRDLASGIALVVDKAESLEDVQDQRQLFIETEPKILEAISAFLRVYNAQLVDELKDLSLPEDFVQKLTIKFNDASPIMSEKEKLDIYEQREKLGLDNLITLLMKDDPSLSEEQAEKKLMKLIEQRMKILSEEDKMRVAAGMPSLNAPIDPANNPDNPNPDPNNPDNPNPMKNAAPGAKGAANVDSGPPDPKA